MIFTRDTLRPALVEILVGMGEIRDDEGAALIASPDSDVALAQLNFDSLAVLDFCLKVETKTDIIFDPDELAELQSFRELETALLAKQPS